MLSQLDIPRFTTLAVAEAASVSFSTLQSWLAREQIIARPGTSSEGLHPGTGRSRLHTARRALHIVLTTRLMPTFSPRVASSMALHFTDMGSDDGSEFGGFGPNIPKRLPGELIDGASRTIFRVLLPASGGTPIPLIERYEDVMASPFIGGHARFQSVLMVDLDDLRARTLASLEASVR